jgi:Asp/Glu/hydantoin racemase
MKRIVLVNPNTSAALTTLMVEIARERAPANVQIEGLTAAFGAPLITCDAELDEAADAVRALERELAQRADAVIVSAFGDPGADDLARLLRLPVIGIAEAGMRTAGRMRKTLPRPGSNLPRLASPSHPASPSPMGSLKNSPWLPEGIKIAEPVGWV